MKYRNNAIILVLAAPLFFACNKMPATPKEKEMQTTIEKLQQENKNLKTIGNEKDEAIKSFVGTLNGISSNLELIKQKENIISLTANDVELNNSEIQNISNDIMLINQLMDQNRRTIDNLNHELANSVIYSVELQQIIDNFTVIVNQQESEIKLLHEQLKKVSTTFVSLQHNIDSLNEANQLQLQKIAEHETMMNTGWYIAGNSNYLSSHDVVSVSGGILGVGSVYLMNEDFDKKEFTQVNISETKKIPLNCNSAKLLSVHPSYSYKFEGTSNYTKNLVITRPREFWSNTKYLVILKK